MMGLFAQYFTLGSGISSLSEIDFTGTPDATGVVDSLDTYLSTGGMWRDGPRDKFAASHVGDLNVYEDGEYTFYLTSDDGSALYIDGKLVISNDGLHAAREQDVTLNLAAGAHKIEIFYFENKGLSTLQLEWVGPDSNGRREVISGDSLSHTVAGEDDSDDTSADNGGSTPDTPDDGDTVVDNGGSTPDTPDSGDTDTGSGSTPDTPDDGPTKTNQGLLARGFVIPAATTSLTQIDFEADSAATFQTTELNSRFRFDPFWKNGPSDYFAVQYAGDLNVATGGKYTFYLTSDDGSALYVDGQLVIDNDGRHPDVSRIITLDLSAGAHDIEVRYFESGAAQTLILEWVGPDSNGRREVISGDSLSHTVAGEDDSDDTSADNGGSTPDTPDNGDTDTGSGSTPDTPDDGDTGADNGGSTPGTPDNGDTDTGSGSTPDTPDDGPTKTNQGLLARGFIIPAATTSLTQIDFEADSAATFQTTELNSRFRFDPFWKNGPSDYFAVQYAGDLNVATGGKYTFYLTSDDGSALYVDGQLVIDNDGRHPDVSRIITLDLSAGAHDIEVRYFESGAAQTLILEWVGPDSNGQREVISGDSLSHTVAGEDDSDDTSADNGGSTPDTPDNGDTDTGSGSTPDTPDDGDTGADNGGSTPGTPDNGDTDTGSGSTPDTPDDGGGAGVPPGTFSLNDDVLFIGHSLVGPNMPAMLQSSVQSKGGFGDVSAQITNGGSIKANWEHSSSAQGVDARAVLPAGEIDVLVITEAVPLLSHLTWSESVEHAKRFYDLAVTSNPDTRVYVYETWHSLLSGTGQDVPFDSNGHIPWRDRLDQDLKEWESIVEYVNANKSPGQPDMHLIPAGQAMGNLYDAIQAGQVPGISSINQFFDDDIHPSDLGNYFLTMVQYATIYGQDPDDLPVQFRDEWGQNFDAPSPALADVLQDIAWETVLEYDHSGFSQGAGDADANDGGSSAPDDAPDDSGSAPDVPDTDDTGSDDGGSAPDTPDDSGMDTGNNDSAPELQGAPALGIGLNGVNDWSTQQPFLDVFKTARAWIGIRPEGGGVVEYDELTSSNYLDANGWPIEIPDGVERIRAGLLTDMPAEAESLAGRYRLSFDGEGEIQVINGQNIEYGDGEIWFDYTPTGSNNIMIDILSTASGGNHIRNISIVHEDNIAAYDAGEIFNPLWTSLIEDMRSVRFMDWMETNNSHQSEWSDRPQVEDFSWAVEGVPLEVMVELANKLGVDPWFNIPHLATQEYIEEFATYVRDNLDPNLKAHFEYSNEAWNWIFEQTFWMAEQSQARWPDQPNWVQFQAVKAVEMAQILDSVFGDQADARIIKVLPTQTDWLGLENDFLYAPNWVAENPTENLPPHTYFDVYAITGYFDGELGRDKALTVKSWIDESLTRALADAEALGLTGAAFDAYVEEHKYDYAVALSVQELRDGSVTGDPSGSLAEMFERFEYHAQVAEAHGLQMVMYEGGTHILGIGEYALDNQLTDFFTYLNYSEEMGIIYEEALAGWVDAGGTMFNAFVDVSSATQYGSWGSLRYLEDDTSRWDTLLEFNASSPVWWDDRPASAFDGTKTNYPVAVDDFVESSDNGSIVIDALSNDYDPEGSMLQISEVGTAEHGVAIAQADGTILYQPNESFTGSDRVDYWVTDEDGLTDQATIVIQLDTWDL